jgi:hypothetical protein
MRCGIRLAQRVGDADHSMLELGRSQRGIEDQEHETAARRDTGRGRELVVLSLEDEQLAAVRDQLELAAIDVRSAIDGVRAMDELADRGEVCRVAEAK